MTNEIKFQPKPKEVEADRPKATHTREYSLMLFNTESKVFVPVTIGIDSILLPNYEDTLANVYHAVTKNYPHLINHTLVSLTLLSVSEIGIPK